MGGNICGRIDVGAVKPFSIMAQSDLSPASDAVQRGRGRLAGERSGRQTCEGWRLWGKGWLVSSGNGRGHGRLARSLRRMRCASRCLRWRCASSRSLYLWAGPCRRVWNNRGCWWLGVGLSGFYACGCAGDQVPMGWYHCGECRMGGQSQSYLTPHRTLIR